MCVLKTYSHHQGLVEYSRRSKGGLLLLVLFLGLSLPLFGEESQEGIALTQQDLTMLQEEFSGLKNDMNELEQINKNQKTLIGNLENLQKSSEELLMIQEKLLSEQEEEFNELIISSQELERAVIQANRSKTTWKVVATVAGTGFAILLIKWIIEAAIITPYTNDPRLQIQY